MENYQPKPYLRAVVEQVENNATSWIGSWQGETKSRTTGQTFTCPTEGDLDSIEIFSSLVTDNGIVEMTIHPFDPNEKTWGPALGTSHVEFNRNDAGKWISFPLTGLHLEKGMSYGFRLNTQSGIFGVGEAASSYDLSPRIGGQEWNATSDDESGKYFSHLSLAFKVDLRA